MPCRCEGYEGYEDSTQDTINKLEAMLCEVIKTLQRYSDYKIGGDNTEDIIRNHFDEDESGIKKSEVMKWYREHLKKDLARQQEEQKKKDKLRNAALKKLSKEEKEALGL